MHGLVFCLALRFLSPDFPFFHPLASIPTSLPSSFLLFSIPASFLPRPAFLDQSGIRNQSFPVERSTKTAQLNVFSIVYQKQRFPLSLNCARLTIALNPRLPLFIIRLTIDPRTRLTLAIIFPCFARVAFPHYPSRVFRSSTRKQSVQIVYPEERLLLRRKPRAGPYPSGQ